MTELRHQESLLKTGALQNAILNSANFSSIATDEKGVIQIFNVGAERMLGYAATDVMNKITPADISDPLEVIARAKALSKELKTPIAPGFEALVFKASRGIEDIYELTYIRKDGSRFPAVVSVTALRDAQNSIIGYLLIGTDKTARKEAEEALLKAGALQSAIFNSANFSSIATDARGVIQIFNVGAERMLGYAAADVMNKITPADISDPQEVIARAEALSTELGTPIAPGFEALVFKASRGIEDIYELTYIRKDGSRFPAVVSVTALRDADNAIIGYLLIGTDNTARKQAEEALLKAGALQSAIFNSANFSSIATDARGVIQIFNVGAERMLGYAAAEVMNKITPADISDPQEVIARAEALSLELETTITPGFEALVFKASRGIEDIYELTYIRKDGSRFPAIVSVTALHDAQNAIIGYLLIGTDNTARKQVEDEQKKLDQRLRDQQFYTRSLIESNIDAIMTTDPAGIITDVNKQMEALTGWTRDELIGAPFKNHFTNMERAEASIKLALVKKRVTNYELTVRASHGKETVVSFNATTYYDRSRRLQGVFVAARDITERKEAEAQILNLALHDSLTGLPNRRLLNERLSHTMAAGKRSGRYSALMFLDLDNFKTLNDTQGHYVGDLLLIEAARRIGSCVREVDVVARFGGDEFVVILNELEVDKAKSVAEARVVAEKLRAALDKPYLLTFRQEGKAEARVEHHCTISIGVVVFLDHEGSQDDILKWADAAMYQAKEAGRNLIRFFDATLRPARVGADGTASPDATLGATPDAMPNQPSTRANS
ncbi:PAS domain S-box protein [Sulfuritalea sp.]|uniref:PAS domain S-box protein n=1 Tax=Sulfuritalea sp. TaxID=2480090 RepID=UPI00286E40A5|nr:PAS domain S-box protein [Sulfuritalea sp.]